MMRLVLIFFSLIFVPGTKRGAFPLNPQEMALSVGTMMKKGGSPERPSCLGYLVGEDLLVTAGHCLKSEECQTMAWDFPPLPDKEEGIRLGCREILERRDGEGLEGEWDYALLRLDGQARGRKVFLVRQSGQMERRAQLLALDTRGIISSGPLVRNDQGYMFYAKLDTPSGSSGGPVVNARTGIVEGILVTRSISFATDSLWAGVSRITNVRALQEGEGLLKRWKTILSSFWRHLKYQR